MNKTTTPYVEPKEFHFVVKKLREFFEGKLGFTEVPTQSRLSIMAACEDPDTISSFTYNNKKYALPQTGQMWLEYELLKDQFLPQEEKPKGYFCLTSSYRQEPNPVEGRHDVIFPLFEFEFEGDMEKLLQIECELLEFLGFGKKEEFPQGDYEDVAKKYGVKTLEHEHEHKLAEDYGSVFLLKNFPKHTSPFWNMKMADENIAKKVDVIVGGMETIGSAERSSNAKEMRHMFETISDGLYKQKLFDIFGEERVTEELDDFFSHKFMVRSGGGIGVTRLISGMKYAKLL